MTESIIRPFRNVDLPCLVDVWIQHWSCVGIAPPVSMATIEQAILARTFFDPQTLLVAEIGGQVQAWCHFAVGPPKSHQPRPFESESEFEDAANLDATNLDATNLDATNLEGRLRAICFSPDEGLQVCDPLLDAAERAMAKMDATKVSVGLVRDRWDGYAGLPPIGHGIGVPAADSRTSSLLSRKGYNRGGAIARMVVNTSPYRPPVSREALQLRRTTRLEHRLRIPTDPRLASSLSHFDIERHQTTNHQTAEVLSQFDLWSSDVEAQVMNCDNAILDLSLQKEPARLNMAETFLIGSLIQRLADRRVYTVETAVDGSQTELIGQLEALQFRNVEQGYQWTKQLVSAS
ncbi:hypothetical protein CA13_70760 [Planctomycetes bacterium CA13]|uniref:N-acetyltransferase domain-containing protein n=1 Tax=Novipirellula herctigrandis TaxID=2527986 RepID=A0A5C5YPB7_9BACT|nr:hypothetical protein CA13_70760 [Planctomycetes bacterium CA13]